jgi:hypothetical protein
VKKEEQQRTFTGDFPGNRQPPETLYDQRAEAGCGVDHRAEASTGTDQRAEAGCGVDHRAEASTGTDQRAEAVAWEVANDETTSEARVMMPTANTVVRNLRMMNPLFFVVVDR